VLADLIRDVVIPRPELHGVYHVATRPIQKFERYGRKIELIPDDRANPDRTLVGARFEKATGYVSPDWQTLVELMYCDRFGSTRF
jgi:dTDP-4-dehydrorhamnose reductase